MCRSFGRTIGSSRFFSRNSSSSLKWIEVGGFESEVLEVGGFGMDDVFRLGLLWLLMNHTWYEE